MKVPDEVEGALREGFVTIGIGEANFSTIDSAIHNAIRRVLSRRGLAGYRMSFVWPTIRVIVLPDEADERIFTYDIREFEK